MNPIAVAQCHLSLPAQQRPGQKCLTMLPKRGQSRQASLGLEAERGARVSQATIWQAGDRPVGRVPP